MNYKEATEIVQKAIDDWLIGDTAQLNLALPALELIYKERAEDFGDHRTGDETYGYSSQENIKNTMEYISDRWECAYRLKWIIDGISAGMFH